MSDENFMAMFKRIVGSVNVGSRFFIMSLFSEYESLVEEELIQLDQRSRGAEASPACRTAPEQVTLP